MLIFKVFLPDSIFDEIARLTNISASIEFHKTEAHKNREWKEVETHEIKKFLALLFLFGIVRKYSVNEYWTSDPLLGLSSVRKIMNKHRFNDIRRYLCFYDRRKKKVCSCLLDYSFQLNFIRISKEYTLLSTLSTNADF